MNNETLAGTDVSLVRTTAMNGVALPQLAPMKPVTAAFKPSDLSVSLDLLEDGLEPPAVLIVDDLDINRRLIRAILKTSDYRILEARRASEVITILEEEKIDLIIVDLVLPEVSGPELCRMIKANRKTQFTQILMLTSVQGVESEVAGISSGADEYLLKPLHPTVMRARVRAMLRSKALVDSLEEAETILFAMAQCVEQRDESTGLHCHRLATNSVTFGKALGLTRPQLLALYRGGFLHDIGKIAIPDAILFKNGRLTEEEWQVMRMHTVKGEEICRPMKSLAPVLPIIRGHHERWDGSGYPDRLAGESIPLLARVLQLVDIYDALTTKRHYKSALTHEAAITMLEDEVSRGWRDPELMPLFAEVARTFVNETMAPDDLFSMQQSLANMSAHLR